MPFLKTAFAGIAGLGLVAAQPAAAAAVERAPSPVSDSEQLAGIPSAAILPLLAMLAGVIFMVIDAENDDDPTSP